VPMAFQYNPLEHYIEINERGEAIVTVNNACVLAPKLRYNVGDEALTMSRPELLRRLGSLEVVGPRQPLPAGWGSPFLFLYGRRDSTVSYMGANIYPIDVEYGLYHDEALAASIESFCLELEEAPDLESRPVVHVQLRKHASVDKDAAGERLGHGLVDYLASASRDFAESLHEDPSGGLRVVLHDHGTGPFAGMHRKIKNVYVVRPS
jgi:phenylacetate-coenzyme A ligase PaaK-like adenylate-forming protein